MQREPGSSVSGEHRNRCDARTAVAAHHQIADRDRRWINILVEVHVILIIARSRRAEVAADSRPMSREELRSALRDSVKHHLIADVPVGVFLSAGLDSTVLASLAALVNLPIREEKPVLAAAAA